MPVASLLRQGSRFHDSERQTARLQERAVACWVLRVGQASVLNFVTPKGVVASSSRLSISYRLPIQP